MIYTLSRDNLDNLRGYYAADTDIEQLLDKTIQKIGVIEYGGGLLFTMTDGTRILNHHYQECCESVYIAEIVGDLDDLVGTPVLAVSEVHNAPGQAHGKMEGPHYDYDSYTWTFYTISTIKGSVTLRWYGASNGYYSETSEFVLLDAPTLN